MKKNLLLTVMVLLVAQASFACDICGCGVGSSYIGILPEFNKKVLGLRYRYNSLKTHIGAGGQTSYLTTDETYRTAELWGGWNMGRKLRLMAYVPLGFHEKRNQVGAASKTGLGDMGAQLFYQVLNQRKSWGTKLVVQSLWVGAGVKAPTGAYDASQKANTSAPTANIFQLGTGSTDFTWNAMYDLRIQDAGWNTTLNYKINTANRENYRYGNKFSASTQFYHKFRIRNAVTIAPNAGLQYETARKDVDAGFKADVSGGKVWVGTLGAELNFSSFAVGANFQDPLSQQLAGGFVQARSRAMVHLSVMF